MLNQIDHFTVGAADLDQGADALRSLLDVVVPRGGKHDAMSTHNCLAQAGKESFLEIIAIDPDAPEPGRRRWFTLDDENTQAKLAVAPRALCWVARTDDLDATIANSPMDLGEVLELSRGDRSWRITVLKDGSLPEGGLLPAFIEWSPGPHPSTGMQDVGIKLNAINLAHPDAPGFARVLEQLQIDHLVNLKQANERSLSFEVKKPNEELVEIV